MPSSLFPKNQNNLFSAINQLKSMANGNPEALYNHMLQTNPQFKAFAESMRGKTPEQAFQEFGYDFNQAKNLFR